MEMRSRCEADLRGDCWFEERKEGIVQDGEGARWGNVTLDLSRVSSLTASLLPRPIGSINNEATQHASFRCHAPFVSSRRGKATEGKPRRCYYRDPEWHERHGEDIDQDHSSQLTTKQFLCGD